MIEQSRTSFFTFQVLFWTCQTLFWILPLGTLFLSTLVPPGCLQQKGLSCLSQARFNHYSYVLTELNETRLAAHGSLVYGSMSALLINLAAVIILVALAKNKKSFAWAESITAVPLATPGAIIALGLIIVAGGRFGLNLYNTPWIVVAAFFIKHLSFAVTPLRTGLGNISSSLIEAAQISGATMSSVWTKIVLPLLKPELLGSFFLVLVPIIGELTMSVFLTSPSFRSFGTVLFDLQDYSDQASAGALALLLVALILLLNFLSRVLSRGKLGY